MNLWFLIAPVGASTALFFALYFFKSMRKQSEGTEKMIEIANYVRVGARAYLKQQYKIIAIFFALAFALFILLSLFFKVQHIWSPFAFLSGGFFSGLAGFIGMKTATCASNRTAEACRHSLNSGLRIAFRSGAVTGLSVVGLGLLNISIWFAILWLAMDLPKDSLFHINSITDLTSAILSFAVGASFQALFARVGGGIFTKAADIGADIVGKLETDIPEDDPRNPAVIADNVGDNVGDVAGMGADLFESYSGSILATSVLGTAAFYAKEALQLNAVLLPITLAGFGILASIIGIFFVSTKESSSQRELLRSLSRGIWVSSSLILIGSYFLIKWMLPGHSNLWFSLATGLLTGIIIGKITEFFTSHEFYPTRNVAKQGLTSTATLIIDGMSVGMMSTGVPVLALGMGILLSFGFGNNWNWQDLANGLYGIGIAAVGMLSTLGITLATDAYGPIADNAGGNAQMSGLGEEVRARTDALDALGNTTAATGKGFAIGSAALTAMALLAAYIEEVKIALSRIGVDTFVIGENHIVQTSVASIQQFIEYYNITLVNPKVIIGLFIGSMTAFVFCALTLKSVGRAAGKMVNEVRRQFNEKKGIMDYTETPDYDICVAISTKAAQKEMILPSIMAIIIPLFVGLILGVAGVMGLLTGSLTTGFTLAIMLNNAGAAWDNAKKYVESGNFGGKGSTAHMAAITGDTVGDPFKDTSGPSLNILIKLMSMVSIIFAATVVSYSPLVESIYERGNSTQSELQQIEDTESE
jgi:K(+)-stimulated pyrophosphate-energized sodium pump